MLIGCFEELFDEERVDVHEFDATNAISLVTTSALFGASLYRPVPNDLLKHSLCTVLLTRLSAIVPTKH